MSPGDYIQFTSTGVRGLVIKFVYHGTTEYAHILCGPDADGDFGGEIRVIPRFAIESRARIL